MRQPKRGSSQEVYSSTGPQLFWAFLFSRGSAAERHCVVTGGTLGGRGEQGKGNKKVQENIKKKKNEKNGKHGKGK
jgi:hypothetical protein